MSESLAAAHNAQSVSESLSTTCCCEATSATARGAVRPGYQQAIAICRASRWIITRTQRTWGVRDENRAASRVIVSRIGCEPERLATSALIEPGPSDMWGDSTSGVTPSLSRVSSSSGTSSSLSPSSTSSGSVHSTDVVLARRTAAERSVRTCRG